MLCVLSGLLIVVIAYTAIFFSLRENFCEGNTSDGLNVSDNLALDPRLWTLSFCDSSLPPLVLSERRAEDGSSVIECSLIFFLTLICVAIYMS